MTFFQTVLYGKGERKTEGKNVEKPDKQYLSQMIKVKINSDVDSMHPRYDVIKSG